MRKNNLILTLIFMLINSVFCHSQTVGLFTNDNSAYDGYTLFTPKNNTSTYLINNKGLLVHEWESGYLPTMTVYLLEDGNLLRSSALSQGGNQKGGFQVLDWDGNVVWQFTQPTQHHDIEPLPNGNVLLILNDLKTKAELSELGGNPENLVAKTRGLKIIEVEHNGEGGGNIVWEWIVWNHLIQDFDSTKTNFGSVVDHPELVDINFMQTGSSDWLHTNGLDYNADFDQIILSNRNVNEIWIIDHSITTEEAASHSGGNGGKGGDLLYRWGNPSAYRIGGDQMLFGQHDAHWIESGLKGEGNILLYNNGIGRSENSFSSADELILPVDENGYYSYEIGTAFGPEKFSWSYKMEPEYYSSKFSSVQRLPNGNTLICSGDKGVLFEINENKDIVWKYINPVNDTGVVYQGQVITNNSVGRCYRYSQNYPGLAGKDLTPGSPIEKYEDVSIENNKDYTDEFVLYNNYPNPFNPLTTISYEISQQLNVKIQVYDIFGRNIKTLVNKNHQIGNYNTIWDGTDNIGNSVSSGVYFYKLSGDTKNISKKMILIK